MILQADHLHSWSNATGNTHLVPKKEHHRAWVIQLVHSVEIRTFRDVHKVYHCGAQNAVRSSKNQTRKAAVQET